MTVLDASVLIAQFARGDVHHTEAVRLLGGCPAPLSTSVVTIAQVLVAPTMTGVVTTARAGLAALGVAVHPVAAEAAVALAAIRATTRLRLPDCVLIHLAEELHEPIATFDLRLARAAEARGLALLRP